nr:MAG: ORF1 [Torque teno midi virus]
MPFWWGRRRKFWYGRFKRRRRTKWNKRRRKPYTRRRPRRFARRRRRRRKYKVRRKKRKIPVMQWQPDSIRKCKIKGVGLIVLGEEGRQMDCYTTDRFRFVPPKVPGGGGFGVENYTLKYLYEEYRLKNNIWTHTNIGKDLCRYLHATLTFYRHEHVDFIINYDRQPPHDINKFTFPSCHPQQLLLEKNKKIILSHASKTNGKYKVRVKIKPPKQMLTKWFFTKPFCEYSLFLLKAAAANMRFSYQAGKSPNRLVNLSSLNLLFYADSSWAQARQAGTPYLPYHGIPSSIQFKIGAGNPFYWKEATYSYAQSISYETGWFASKILRATEIISGTVKPAVRPMTHARYNPAEDTGEGNLIYIVSILHEGWDVPRVDKNLVLEGMPLWLGLFGLVSYLKTIKPLDFLRQCVVVIKSKALYCSPEIGGCDKYVPIDEEYIQGKKPWDLPITSYEKQYWYPTIYWQLKTLNALVESGPYIPKYSEEVYSNWELKYNYSFYFKWGGPQLPEQDVKNPQQLNEYNVPDTVQGRIQITNPQKQATETIIHPWDTRRGFIKEAALKRMYEHLETDTEFEPYSETTKKIKLTGAALQNPFQETEEIQSCLLSLCEEGTCQKEETLENLIKQQQQQQQQLKYTILKLLFDLKDKQKMLQLQTGMLE